nr:heme exporter protein CcmB [Acidobacteriota bacterium]
MKSIIVVARKDLRIEGRSRTLLARVVPFALLVLVLFAVALDSEPLILRASAGLVWMAMLFATMLVVQRSFEIETSDAALDSVLSCTSSPSRVYFGKALATFVQLFALATLLVLCSVVLYGSRVDGDGLVLLVTVMLTATAGLSLVGTLYGVVVARLNGRDSLLPLLSLPVLAPLLIGAARATEAAFGSQTIDMSNGWAWTALLAVYAVVFGSAGAVAFAPLAQGDS